MTFGKKICLKLLMFLTIPLLFVLLVKKVSIPKISSRKEKSMSQFEYPLEGDIRIYIELFRTGEPMDKLPINDHDYTIRSWNSHKCINQTSGEPIKDLTLVVIVKSSVDHFTLRQVIRRTWGQEFRFTDVNIRTVFMLGTHPNSVNNDDDEFQRKVDDENSRFQDIVQGDFVDAYYNNTLKMMMSLKWAAEACDNAQFYAFIDDDYYVSMRNMFKFLRNPPNYPSYLLDPIKSTDCKEGGSHENENELAKNESMFEDVGKMYAGFVFHGKPMRHKSNKWYVSRQDYPFDSYPPYVTAGSFVLSKSALMDFYHGSYFVKFFPFDDVFLGLIAKKLAIEPLHVTEFRFNKKSQKPRSAYKFAVTSHGFSDYIELETVWNKQRILGFA